MKNISFLVFVFFQFSIVFSQNNNPITIGTKFPFPNKDIDNLIAKGDYNYYDSFEYEFLSLFDDFVKKNNDTIKIEYKSVSQAKKLQYLDSGEVDAIVFSVSITKSRIDNGYKFSKPYFSNNSIVLISNNPKIDARKLQNNKITIGTIKGTTSYNQLKLIRNKYIKTIKLDSSFKNIDNLIVALNEKKIDAIAGDFSRLVYFVHNNVNIYFSGILPTPKAQTKDEYGVISKNNTFIIDLFNQFINDNRNEIQNLRDKYFANTEYMHAELYSRNYNPLLKNILYFLSALTLLLVLTILFFLRKIKKIQLEKEEIQSKQIVDGTAEKLAGILDKAFSKFREKLDSEQIVDIGVDFFKTAKEKITYVGSGGFLSDKKYSKVWKNAIHNALERNIIFDRIIDLPEIDFKELTFNNMEYFHPETYDRSYVKKYLRWLLLQYIDLMNYDENYKIHNSRGASLWGYGIVIMIKDNTEVLIFTTNKDKKIGSVIVNQDLASYFLEIMNIIKNVGKEIDEHDLERNFFSEENNLKKMITSFKNEYNRSSTITLTPDFEKEIDQIAKGINKRFIEKNIN